jgi:hypothetical protein
MVRVASRDGLTRCHGFVTGAGRDGFNCGARHRARATMATGSPCRRTADRRILIAGRVMPPEQRLAKRVAIRRHRKRFETLEP